MRRYVLGLGVLGAWVGLFTLGGPSAGMSVSMGEQAAISFLVSFWIVAWATAQVVLRVALRGKFPLVGVVGLLAVMLSAVWFSALGEKWDFAAVPPTPRAIRTALDYLLIGASVACPVATFMFGRGGKVPDPTAPKTDAS